jgi:hypothetical protein
MKGERSNYMGERKKRTSTNENDTEENQSAMFKELAST